MAVRIGLERVCEQPPDVVSRGRFGLLMNQASLDDQLRYACHVLAARFPGQLAALFAPQHGFWGLEQANMIPSSDAVHDQLGIPIYSLYGQVRQPTRAMLDGLDCVVVDLQDVGTRVYTFAWTLSNMMHVCAQLGIEVVVLDRPNPTGGRVVEGPRLDSRYCSFVGGAPIPMRHALTLGELAAWLNHTLQIHVPLTVVPMTGWSRSQLFGQLVRPWLAPSPNLPRWETTLLYPGMVLLEGTNLSEGRGTTRPFELFGAPYIEPQVLLEDLSVFDFPGLRLVPVRFRPMFDKWRGRECGGLVVCIDRPDAVRSYRLAVAVIACVRRRWPRAFRWRSGPYEYETVRPPIDVLSGSDELRGLLDRLDGPVTPEVIATVVQVDDQAWWCDVGSHLLY